MSKSLDGVLVKKAHSKTKFDQKHLYEFSQCCDPKTGPLFFLSNFFNIQHAKRGRLLYQPFDFQRELIDTYVNNRFSINLLSRQTGKALDITTPILTPAGFKSLEDIHVGDVIYGSDGKETNVTFTTDVMRDHQCYRVVFDNGDDIIADADHIWTVKKGSWATGKNPSRNLTTKELIAEVPSLRKKPSPYIPIADAIAHPKKDLPMDPYLLGIWIGDGGTRDARVTCHIDDLPTYEKAGIVENICSYSMKYPTIRHFRITGGQRALKENKLYGHKHIPEAYFTASFDQRLSLLQGLMDSDGSIDKRCGRCEFYQKDEALIDQVRILISSLGIKSRKKYKMVKSGPYEGNIYWTIGFKTDLPVFKLKRKLKYVSSHKVPKNKRLYIYKIEPVESVPVKCIQVDNDSHLFLAGLSLIPTHNTTTAAGYLLWYAMFVPDSTILIAAHKYSGVQEIMQRIRYAYELCPDHIRAGVPSYNKGSIEFDNGSRIVAQATTESTGRGMSLTLIYLDEFAFVRPTIAKEFWTSISPTLATGGGAIITSTPNSDEDQFALLWKEANKTEDEFGNTRADGLGINGFKAYQADWKRHPERDQKWADDELARIGEERFRREHLNEFLIFDETLIAPTKLVDMEGVEPIRKAGQVRWYQEPKPGMIYTVALDPSLGTGGDYAAIQIFEANTTTQIGEWKHNKSTIPTQIRILADIVKYISEKCHDANNVYYSVENNTIGEAALISIEEYGESNISGVFLSEPKRAKIKGRRRKGFNTNTSNKTASCSKLKTLVESDKMVVKSKSLISEFKNFVALGVSFSAKPGEHDDLVMAVVLTVRMLQVLKNYHKELASNLRDFGDDVTMPMPFIAMF